MVFWALLRALCEQVADATELLRRSHLALVL
jgi:hypothetical protein